MNIRNQRLRDQADAGAEPELLKQKDAALQVLAFIEAAEIHGQDKNCEEGRQTGGATVFEEIDHGGSL